MASLGYQSLPPTNLGQVDKEMASHRNEEFKPQQISRASTLPHSVSLVEPGLKSQLERSNPGLELPTMITPLLISENIILAFTYYTVEQFHKNIAKCVRE
ncbi:hypothetical protein TNCV_4246371 [Trichonephila clavipes]|nr:hypothetical protein TNCV_4246371 [Trichonephila clavipes]